MAATRGMTLRVTRGETFAGETDLEVMCCSSCAILYAVPERLVEKAREDHETDWCCPNGHSQYFPGKTPEQVEKEFRDRLARERALRDQAEASAQGFRSAATRARNERDRLKARAAAGVCPCCNRTFQHLARHMASQHPEFVGSSKARHGS